MIQSATDREIYTYLIHDVQSLDSTMHSKLVRVNEEIRRINKQPYIHKQVDYLSKLKESRKVIDKMISKINDLLDLCKKGKSTSDMKDLKEHTDVYKSLKEDYFKLQ